MTTEFCLRFFYISACDPGFFGMNCNTKCPPTRYGVKCSLECKCSEQDCHHVNGCTQTSKGICLLIHISFKKPGKNVSHPHNTYVYDSV